MGSRRHEEAPASGEGLLPAGRWAGAEESLGGSEGSPVTGLSQTGQSETYTDGPGHGPARPSLRQVFASAHGCWVLERGVWRVDPGGPAVGLLGKLNGSSLVLFRLERQRRQSKPLTLLLTCLDTALPTFLRWVQVAWHHRWQGGRSWNCGAPGGGLANHTRGLITFQDLQDKTNGTVKKKKKIKPEPHSALRLMTISVCGLGLKAGTPNLQF